jgi:SagB-type dehydrogenase family enzyme
VPAPADAPPPLDLKLLGTILFLTGGISGTRPFTGGDIRTTAAAGALYPNELYAVTGHVPGLSPGVYHYDPKRGRLSRLRRGDWRPMLAAAAADDRVRRTPATIVLTGILWRSAWKYRERGYRHLYWDGGMMLAHTLAAAEAAGLPATVLAAFVDAELDRLIGIDGRREKTLALVPIGAPSDTAEGNIIQTGREVAPLALESTPLSPHPIDYAEALRYHVASTLHDARTVRSVRRARLRPSRLGLCTEPARSLPPTAAGRQDPTLDAVIRRRRSTRRFAQKPIAATELAAVLERPTRGAAADFLASAPTLLETYVIVSAVRGVEPGAYHYRRTSNQLELLKAGDFRQMAGFLCLGQALARDASAVLYYLADLNAAADGFGERGYRFAELEAGLIAGRAYLAAHAVGRGVTGLTFYDDEVTRFFSPHADGLDPLLVVAVGVPRKQP